MDSRFVSQDIIDATNNLVKSLSSAEREMLRRLEKDGYEAKAVQLVQFVDDYGNIRPATDVERDKRRWFSKPHRVVAHVLGIFDGAELINQNEINQKMLELYGPDTFSIH